MPDHVAALTERLLWAERDLLHAEQRAQAAARKAEQMQEAQRGAEAALQVEHRRSAALQAQLASLYASTSWKLSRPVRALAKLQRVVQRLAGRPTEAAPQPASPPPSPVAAPVMLLDARPQAMLNRLLGRI